MRVYLDCCCFNRHFDNLSQVRVRLEAEAVEWVLEESVTGRFTLVTSDYVITELLRNPDAVKRSQALAATQYSQMHVPATAFILARATQIEELGIGAFDALHVAAAEAARCDYFLTTDDRLLKKSLRHHGKLMVTVLNPLDLTALP